MLEGIVPSNIPIPDPSVRTTEQLYRELQTQREVLEVKINALSDLADDKIASLKELINQQISSSKEAITKSELSFAKDIDSMKSAVSTQKDGFSIQLQNLSSRMDRWDGLDKGAKDNRADAQMTIGSVVGVVGGIVGALTLAISLWAHNPAANPAVGENTKRVDDLIASANSRFEALSARLNSVAPAVVTAPPKQP